MASSRGTRPVKSSLVPAGIMAFSNCVSVIMVPDWARNPQLFNAKELACPIPVRASHICMGDSSDSTLLTGQLADSKRESKFHFGRRVRLWKQHDTENSGDYRR